MSDSVRPHRRQPTRIRRPWDSPGKNTGMGCHFLLQCMKVKSESEVAQSCLTLRDSMNCSLPGSSIHGIFQARVLEWLAIAFSETPSYDPPILFTQVISDSFILSFICKALYLQFCPAEPLCLHPIFLGLSLDVTSPEKSPLNIIFKVPPPTWFLSYILLFFFRACSRVCNHAIVHSFVFVVLHPMGM